MGWLQRPACGLWLAARTMGWRFSHLERPQGRFLAVVATGWLPRFAVTDPPPRRAHRLPPRLGRMDWGTVIGIGLGLVVVWAVLVALLWVLRPRDIGLGEVVRIIPDLLRLVRDLLRDRSVPLGARVALVVLLAWLISPIDLIPEFIPILGPIDDVVVAVLVLRYVRRRLGPDELRRRWSGTPEGFALLSRVLG